MSSSERIDADHWRHRAACQGEWGGFLPAVRPEKKAARIAVSNGPRRCAPAVDVRAECLEQAITNGERYGVWGGLTDVERRSSTSSGRSRLTPAASTTDRDAAPRPQSAGRRRGPAIRRSPRRRVMPRASSSSSSGTAYLRVVPAASRNCDRETVGVGEQQPGDELGRRRRCASRWKQMPSRSTTQPAPDAVRAASSRSMSSGGGGREPAGRERGEQRMLGERVDGAGRPGDAVVDRDVVELGQHGPLALVEPCATSRPSAAAASTRARSSAPAASSAAGVDRPSRPTVGSTPLAGQRARSSSTSTQPRSATTRSTVAVGRRLATPAAPGRRRAPRRRRPSRRGPTRGARSGRRAAAAARSGRWIRTAPVAPGASASPPSTRIGPACSPAPM